MYFVYALQSLKRSYIYVGMSANLKQRISRHNAGYERTTKPYAPFVLIFFEVVDNRPEARQREKYWKSAVGKRKLKKIAAKMGY
ncbi:MAG: GIY-YIG nuclease family protein [Bacteroidetes bacterium]|jgi:putative endonuclease|nr:GIY-YIG nuclease family protein [Bacteroidota bacterium]